MAKNKFYVVWQGAEPGVYDSWDKCKKQIHGIQGAQYMGFPTQDQAEAAFKRNYWDVVKGKKSGNTAVKPSFDGRVGSPIVPSISVDAACSGNPGVMEYRGVETETGAELFRQGPYAEGTNNIGEFLALVHGLAMLKKMGSELPIYTDSITALAWVKAKKCKTKLERTVANNGLFDMVDRAEIWLNMNSFTNKIYKWKTEEWGEIPADFGRK